MPKYAKFIDDDESNYPPPIFDMEYDSDDDDNMVKSTHSEDNCSPCGVDECLSPYLNQANHSEPSIGLKVIEKDNKFFVIDTEESDSVIDIEENLDHYDTIETEFSPQYDGLFFPQPVCSYTYPGLLISMLKDSESKPSDFLKPDISIFTSMDPRILWVEVMEEIYCYHVHHQIRRFREHYDDVLVELLNQDEHPDEDFSLVGGFPGLSRSSTPGI